MVSAGWWWVYHRLKLMESGVDLTEWSYYWKTQG